MGSSSESEHEGNMNSGDEGPSTRKKLKYSQKYKTQWENEEKFKNWVTCGKTDNTAYCKTCNKTISIKSTGRIALIRHNDSAMHQKLSVSIKGQQTLTSLKKFSSLEVEKKKSDLYLAAFVSEHNLSYNIMGHLVQLLPKVCPDSEIAKKIKCGSTKCSSLVKNAIGKQQLTDLCDILKHTRFSLIIDESTDRGCTKHLCLVVRYHLNDRIKDTFLALLPLQGATAEDLYRKIVNCFERYKIPYKNNMIGFAADGANVMVGLHNSILTRLRSDIPDIFILKCICHSFNLCASSACLKLPRGIEDLVRNIYNFFANSPKRVKSLKQFQDFTNTPIHKILHPAQTRWLSLESAVNRILEQYNALILYFTDAVTTEGVLCAQNILNDLKNPLTKPFLLFLQFILPLFTNINKEMQSEQPKIHQLHSEISASYKTLLEYFIKRDVLRKQPLHLINYKDPGNFLPIEEMYLGAKISISINEMNMDSAHVLRTRCLQFYIESAAQINKRFDFNNQILIHLTLIDPKVAMHEKSMSITPLAKYFPNLIKADDLQDLDNQWRLFRNTDGCIAASESDISAVEFWNKISKIKRGDQTSVFPLLSSFAFNMLSLPHSSANVERIFSEINLMKTNVRNRLSTASIVGHLHTKHYLKIKNQNCFSMDFPKEIIKLHNASIYKNNEDGLTDSSESDTN